VPPRSADSPGQSCIRPPACTRKRRDSTASDFPTIPPRRSSSSVITVRK
jgi:hypothetical protein